VSGNAVLFVLQDVLIFSRGQIRVAFVLPADQLC
jgi:hypothetical protein